MDFLTQKVIAAAKKFREELRNIQKGLLPLADIDQRIKQQSEAERKKERDTLTKSVSTEYRTR